LAEWFSISFLIGLSIAIGISSWLGENFGYKKVFIFSVAGFAVFSLGCSLAGSFEMFVISRFLQGFFGGIIIPVGNAILYMSCDKKDYAKVTAFVFLPTLIAPAIAPYIGGTLLKYFSYKSIFYINLPICLAIVIVAFFVINENHKFDKKSFDFKGFFVSGVLYAVFFTGVSFVSQNKFAMALQFLTIAAFLALWFVKIEQKTEHPIWDFKYLKLKLFRQVMLIQLFFQMSHFGSFFIVGLYLQLGLGFSPQHTGIIIAMQAVGAIIARLPAKYILVNKPDKKISLGCFGVAFMTPLILFISNSEQIFFACFIMLFRGILSGWVGPNLQYLSMSVATNKVEIGRLGSITNIARQLSISLGICVSSLLIGLSNLYFKFDYINQCIGYSCSLRLFGGGILIISVFSLIAAKIAFNIIIQDFYKK
jgi:MFS family permease